MVGSWGKDWEKNYFIESWNQSIERWKESFQELLSDYDKIRAKMIKYIGRKRRKLILEIWQKIGRRGILNDSKKSFRVPIDKNKGNNKDCNNYRGIKNKIQAVRQWNKKRFKNSVSARIYWAKTVRVDKNDTARKNNEK